MSENVYTKQVTASMAADKRAHTAGSHVESA